MTDGGLLTLETANVHLADEDEADRIGVAPGDYVSLSVTDTGSGIAPEILKHVFEPFFTTKEVGDGSGLGLSMVYGFTAQSGGGIRIDSAEGSGTKITLLLARADEAGERPEAGADADADGRVS
jgi:signal transduction histidine kinase